MHNSNNKNNALPLFRQFITKVILLKDILLFQPENELKPIACSKIHTCEGELINMTRAQDKEKFWVLDRNLNPWPPKHQVGALSIELRELMESKVIELRWKDTHLLTRHVFPTPLSSRADVSRTLHVIQLVPCEKLVCPMLNCVAPMRSIAFGIGAETNRS